MGNSRKLHERGRAAPLHRLLRRPAGRATLGRHLRQPEGRRQGLAAGRAKSPKAARRSRPGPTDLPAVRRGRVAPQPRHGTHHPRGLHLRHLRPHHGHLRPMRMREILPSHVREWVTELGRADLARPTSAQQDHPQRHLHHGSQRPGDRLAPLQGGQDADRADQAAADRHPRGVRPALPAPARRESRLLVETDIDGGMRWGELTELRLKDIDFAAGWSRSAAPWSSSTRDSTPRAGGSSSRSTPRTAVRRCSSAPPVIDRSRPTSRTRPRTR